MYILYESYSDDLRNENDFTTNTKIIGVYNNEDIATREIESRVDDIIINTDNWFSKKEEVLDNNMVRFYKIYRESLNNELDYYVLVLEKLEVRDYDK